MIYYPFFPADYAVDTAQLSDIEDLMYRRLLDAYYTQEQPLTTDKQRLYRLVRAFSMKQRRAVDFIIESFFVLKADQFCNKKADDEIARYLASVEQCRNAGKVSAQKRKQRLGRATSVPTTVATVVPTVVITDVPTTGATRRPTTNPTTQTHTKTQTHTHTQTHTKQTLSSAKEIIKKNHKLGEGKGGREAARSTSAVNGHPPPSLSDIEKKDKKMTLELFNSLRFETRQDFEVYYKKYHPNQEPRWKAMKAYFKRNIKDNQEQWT